MDQSFIAKEYSCDFGRIFQEAVAEIRFSSLPRKIKLTALPATPRQDDLHAP